MFILFISVISQYVFGNPMELKCFHLNGEFSILEISLISSQVIRKHFVNNYCEAVLCQWLELPQMNWPDAKFLAIVAIDLQVLWLRLRFHILRALALALSLVPSPPQNIQAMNNGTAEPAFPLHEVITDLTDVLEEVDKHPGTRETVLKCA